jgi:hypothetical protein
VTELDRHDVEAALQARRELGPEYEDEIVDSLVAKIEQRLAKLEPRTPAPRGSMTPLAMWSMFWGVGGAAVALGNGAAWVAVVVWTAIVLVNVGVARRR